VGLLDFLKKKEEIPYAKIADILNGFTIESLAMPKMNNPFLLNDTTKHPMIFGYFMGAMQHIAEVYHLSKEEERTLYTQYLAKHFSNNDEDKTKALLEYSHNLSQTEEGAHYMLLGAHAIKKWMGEGPIAQYAAMGLIRLLNG
jgi:hypothetical protein